MATTVKVGSSSATIHGADALLNRLKSMGRFRGVFETIEEVAETVLHEAREGWPVSRDITGQPKDSSGLTKTVVSDTERGARIWVSKYRGKHSRDYFSVRGELRGEKYVVTLSNDSPYAYYIRSRQVKEPDLKNQDRFRLRRGESPEEQLARQQFGKKRHAWTVLVRTPMKRAVKKAAPAIAAATRRALE